MCKEILGNQKGMSLIEVVVASAVSIIIAMGVMQINDNAQKGISKLTAMTNIQKFEDLVHTRLSKQGRCNDANIGGSNTLLGTDITSNVALPRLRTAYQTGSEPDEFTVSTTVTIPSAPDWRVRSAVMSAFNAGGPGALVGECDIIITVDKVKQDSIGMRTKIIRIPMSCRVDTNDVIEDCSAIIDSDEEGYWKSTADGVGGDFVMFSGTTGDPRIKVGGQNAFAANAVSAAITVDPIAGQNDSNGRLHGMALPNNTTITFGAAEASLYSAGGNTISSNGGFDAVGNIAGNQFYANTYHGGTLRVTNAHIGSGLLAGGVTITSDERYKHSINTIKNASDSIEDLRGVTYFMRREEFPHKQFSKKLQHGLIAQEVEKTLPNLVNTDEDSGYKSVNYISMVAILIEAFKEQKIEIEKNKKMFLVMKEGIRAQDAKQNSRLDVLEKENKALRSELDELKEQVRKILKNKED